MGRAKRIITVNGVSKSMAEWVRETGIPDATIRSRLDTMGWSPEDAVSVPIEKKFSRIRRHRQSIRECPRMLKHKSDGRAYCTWLEQGQKVFKFFGRHGSAMANRKYREFATEWIRCGGPPTESEITWGELVRQWLIHVDQYYRKNGKRTSYCTIAGLSVKSSVEQFGDSLVSEMTVNDLRAIREEWIATGYYRQTVNQLQQAILNMLKWGVGQLCDDVPLVPVEMYQTWRLVEKLKMGRTHLRESKPRASIDWPTVEATLNCVVERYRKTVNNLVRLHWLIGCRPGEICAMRGVDLHEVNQDVWRFTCEDAKTSHLGKTTMYAIGPKGIEILKALGVKPGEGVKKVFRLNRAQYGNIIRAACKVSGLTSWVPHQIRHSRATEIMRVYESNKLAAEGIGDTEEVTREVYIDRELSAAKIRIARELG